jgi:hypothetical protein
MFYVDINIADWDVTLTLGSEDTLAPPPLYFEFLRHGTNNSSNYSVPDVDISKGERYITIDNIPTSLFEFSGQYHYWLYDNTDPGNRELIETGILAVLDTPITIEDYGTDKERGEHKGSV